jgi:hypothetical protein
MTNRTIEQVFEAIRRDYFPQWDRAKQWRVQHGSRREWTDSNGDIRCSGEQGYCDLEAKTIYVGVPRGQWRFVLIHEICHAVASRSHCARFITRLEKAAAKARRLGHLSLAQDLDDEVQSYEDGSEVDSSQVYALVEDALVANPRLSFHHLLEYVSCELGAYSPEELESKYPRLRAIYDRRLKEAARELSDLLERLRALEASPESNPGLIRSIKRRIERHES